MHESGKEGGKHCVCIRLSRVASDDDDETADDDDDDADAIFCFLLLVRLFCSFCCLFVVSHTSFP